MNFLTEDDIKDILKLNNRKTKALMRTEGFSFYQDWSRISSRRR